MALKDTLQSAQRTIDERYAFGLPSTLVNLGLAAWLFVGVVVALVILGGFIVVSASISVPLILAAVIGAVSYPVAENLQRRGLSAGLAAWAVLVALLAVIGVTVWIAAAGIIAQWPSLVAGAKEGIAQLVATLESYGWNAEALRTAFQQVVSGGQADVGAAGGLVSGFVSSLASGLSGVFGLFFGIFIAVTLLYYILHDFDQVTSWLGDHIGLPSDLGRGVVEDGISSMRGYFRGTTLTGLAVAFVIGVGAWALGIPLALPIALVTFVTCYIPYFGAIFSGAFAFLVALGAGGMPKAIAILVLVLVAQNVLQTVILARFMGDSLKLHPIVVLVVTMLGGTLGGLLLAALAAPLTAMGVRSAERIRTYRELGSAPPEPAAERSG